MSNCGEFFHYLACIIYTSQTTPKPIFSHRTREVKMVAKYFFIVFSCFFILQIHNVRCGDPPNNENVGNQSTEKEFSNDVARKAINTMLRHFKIIATNQASAFILRHLMSTLREIVTNPNGQADIENFVEFLVNVLLEPNTEAVVKTLHRKMLEALDAGPTAPLVMESASITIKKVLNEPNILPATEGFIEGFNLLLEGMDEDKLRLGVARLKKLQKFSFVLKPFLKHKIPNLKPMKSTQSLTIADDNEVETATDVEISSRDLGWINDKPTLPFMDKFEKDTAVVSVNGDI